MHSHPRTHLPWQAFRGQVYAYTRSDASILQGFMASLGSNTSQLGSIEIIDLQAYKRIRKPHQVAALLRAKHREMVFKFIIHNN